MGVATRRMTIPYDVNQNSGTILDILQQYANVCANEFCGKCMPCRYGTKEWAIIIEKMNQGQGTLNDLKKLQDINNSMKVASFCRLGLISPFMVDSILKYYHADLEAFLVHKTPLPQNVTELPMFKIDESLCNGCANDEKAPCQKVCTVNAVDGEAGGLHTINQAKCYRCDACVSVCPTSAISFIIVNYHK